MRRLVAAHRHTQRGRAHQHLVERPRFGHRLLPRNAFLQQQLGGAHPGVGVEAFDHPVAGDGIGNRDQRHAGMMGEEGRHHHALARLAGLRAGTAAVGVVDRLVEPVVAEQPRGGQPAQVTRAPGRIHEHRQRGGVRRDHQLVTEPALQAEAGHAEGLVLIIPVAIHGGVGRFGNAPRRAAGGAVVDLPPHRHPARRIEQRGGIAAHQQQRHQVLEQRRRPRQQHGRAMHAGNQPAQAEPVHLRHVALRDGNETGEPGFRREQVIVRGIEAGGAEGVGQTEANREQPALAVVQEREVHLVEVDRGAGRERFQPRRVLGRGAVVLHQRPQADRQREQRPREVAAVDGGHVLGRQRFERAGVVPVQQVSFEVFQPVDRGERVLEPVEQRPGVNETEIVCRQRREQAHRNIGGRGAVRHPRFGVELNVVGREEAMFLGDEGVEVSPRLLGDRQEIRAVIVGDLRAQRGDWLAQHEGDQRRRDPECENQQRDRQRGRPRADHQQQPQAGNQRAGTHG